MKIAAKYKVCRRLGNGVFDKCQTQGYLLSEAHHAKFKRPGRAPSDYGRQLIEKQRIRFGYGISERQLRNYVEEAGRIHGTDPVRRMVELLESRLDNAVYRAGLATTRRQARQLVTHGHITVNGRRTDIPSYSLKQGDTFAVREGSREKSYFAARGEQFERAQAPAWISFDSKALAATVKAAPSPESIDVFGDIGTVLEFYSR